jgi:hypothetical protein
MASPIEQPDAEFVCVRWELLVPNGNIQTVTTRDVRGVIKLYDWVCHV